MFNADCHVGVVYLIMCKPTTLLHATLYVLFSFCTVRLRVYNLLITYDDDDDETENPTSPTLKTCEWEQSGARSQPMKRRGTSSWRMGTGWGANKCRLPSRCGTSESRPRIFFYIFNTNPAFWCILWLRKWALPVFSSRPLRIGWNEDCWERLLNEARRPKIKAEGVLEEGAASSTS